MANQISSIFKLKCPKCGKGDLFCNKNVYQYKGFFDMPKNCSNCNQDFEIEPGFYYGAMYVSYALTIALTVSVFVAMVVLNVFNIKWFLVIDFLVLLIGLPYIFKISRSLWLTIMVKPEKGTIKNNDIKA